MTDIYTPDEQLHRKRAAEAQRDRFVMRYLSGQIATERKLFGAAIVNAIADRLRTCGYDVVHAGANEHFDLLCDGIRIEVKAAARSSGRYQAAMRSNDADICIFVCHAAVDYVFVIPFDEVRHCSNIAIRTDPVLYAGRFKPYLEAWHLLPSPSKGEG